MGAQPYKATATATNTESHPESATHVNPTPQKKPCVHQFFTASIASLYGRAARGYVSAGAFALEPLTIDAHTRKHPHTHKHNTKTPSVQKPPAGC